MKKRIFLRTLVALAVLSSMLLSTLLGVSEAIITKTLSKKLDFEVINDLDLAYYLYDADSETSTSTGYAASKGLYENAHSFSQEIIVGKADQTSNAMINSNGSTAAKVYTGKSLVYQLKIPVDETGYYTLSFTPEFIKGTKKDNKWTYTRAMRDSSDKYIEQDFYTVSYQYAVGCEILNAEDNANLDFPTMNTTPASFSLESRIFGNNEYYKKQNYLAESAFQWKTLCISRAENVKLTYKATTKDVEKGYVIWAWELTGLRGESRYMLNCTSVSFKKFMELDGSTRYRESYSEPYFMLPKTLVTNNQVKIYGQVDEDEKAQSLDGKGNSERRGSSVSGRTDYSGGRGTYVTNVSTNSIGLRAETLTSGLSVTTSSNAPAKYDNPISFQIPLKNVKYNTTYKVTFDFSVARQGLASPSNDYTSNCIQKDVTTVTRYYPEATVNPQDKTGLTGDVSKNMWDYTQFSDIFNRPSESTDLEGRTFYSYLSSFTTSGKANDYAAEQSTEFSKKFNVSRLSNLDHEKALAQITYNHKALQGQPLTKYDQVTSLAYYANSTSKHNYPDMTTSRSVNDTYSIDYFNPGEHHSDLPENDIRNKVGSTMMRNWFNAVQNTEMNGQVAINWITFYNTTFSFNIPEGGVNLDELYWVWAIDALVYESFYNIKIENLRIEEVVQYSSKLETNNAVKIGNTIMGLEQMNSWGKNTSGGVDTGLFRNFRGWNGTGQNFQARGYDITNYYATGNVAAPIVDAKKAAATPGGGYGANDYKIYLDGYAVCTGGIDKYVWSADGGITWYDMTFTGSNATTSILKTAENGIDQRTRAQNNTTLEPKYEANHKDHGTATYCADCSLPDDNKPYVDFVTFKGNDALNSNFSAEKTMVSKTDADGKVVEEEDLSKRVWRLEADISPYRGQSDLDIIIAAVPASNTSLRCEILRIINYNAANTYVSQVTSIKSDIYSTGLASGDATSGQLSLAVGDLTVTNGACGTSNIFDEGTYSANHYPVYDNGVMYHMDQRTASDNSKSGKIDYASLQPTYSNLPIKKTLTVVGGVVCSDGVYEYAYSVDGGKSWTTIDARQAIYHIVVNGTALKDTAGKEVTLYKDNDGKYRYYKNLTYTEADGKTYTVKRGDVYKGKSANLKYNTFFDLDYDVKSGSFEQYYENLLYKWISRNTGNDGRYFTNANGDFHSGGGGRLYIDLDAYAGQVLDVIVAVKPNFQGDGTKNTKTDVYLPIAKIDNVAVYGEDGTFYTRVHKVTLDRVNDTGSAANKNELTGDTTYGDLNDDAVLKDVEGNLFNGGTEWPKTVATSKQSYTIYEPQNVNVVNTRMYNQVENKILSAGKVTIDGYIICKGGVNRYKYSLDGGETWTIIDDLGTDIPADSTDPEIVMFSNCLKNDATFNREVDGKNGDFCCTGIPGATDDKKDDHALEFDLPAFSPGTVKNLLVVAESNDAEGKPSGKLFPVLHLRLKFYHAGDKPTQYGYFRSYTKADGNRKTEAGYIYENEAYTFTLGTTNDVFNRLTVPVAEVGTHNLTFDLTLKYNDANGSNVNKNISCTLLSDNTKGGTLFANIYDEPIRREHENVIYDWGSKKAGAKKTYTITFEVTPEDVKRGYVIWDWDLRTLPTGKTYHFRLDTIRITKT